MVYIYDIVLNWSDNKLFEFFEWEDDDEIEYVKKIPIFKVSNFSLIKDNCIKVEKDFLNKIYYKTEVYGNKKQEKVEYSCIFCSDKMNDAIACEFNESGECIYRSGVNIFDLEDIFELVFDDKVFDIKYEIIYKYKNINLYFTREELKKKKIILYEINQAFKNNNIDKLKYIYYEIFGELDDDMLLMKNKMIKHLNLDLNFNINKLYDILKTPNFM